MTITTYKNSLPEHEQITMYNLYYIKQKQIQESQKNRMKHFCNQPNTSKTLSVKERFDSSYKPKLEITKPASDGRTTITRLTFKSSGYGQRLTPPKQTSMFDSPTLKLPKLPKISNNSQGTQYNPFR